jgi:MFS family permease
MANQIAATAIGLSLLIIAIPHVVALFVGSLGLGIAYGMTNPAASHLMMKIASPTNRNLIFSVKQTGQPLGGVVAGLMAPPIAIAFGWQWSLMAGAFLALSTVLLIQPLRAKLDGDRDPTTKFRGAVFKDVSLVLRIRELRLLALAALTFSGVQLALMTFAVTMLVEDVKFDLVLAGVGLAVIQIAGVVGRLGWGVIADRNGDGRKTLLFAQSLSVVAAVATVFLSDSMPLVAVFGILFLFGMSAVGWNGVFMAEIGRLAPEGKIGSATGGVLVPTFIGVMMGPLVFSAIHEVTATYTMSFAVLALVTMTGMVPILMMRGSRQKE